MLDRVRAQVAAAYTRTHARFAQIVTTEQAVLAATDSWTEDLTRIRAKEGLPIEVFDNLRSSLVKDRSQFYADLATPFYGANRPGAKVSQGILDQFWLWSMQAGLFGAYESIKAFSETDFTEDLKKFDVPTLVLHGEDDQIVPVHDSARKSAKLIKGAKEIYYPGAPHGMTATHQDQVNSDLLAFLQETQRSSKVA